MSDIRIPPDCVGAVERVLNDPADKDHTAFQQLRRRIKAAVTPKVLLQQWEANPHESAEHLATLVVAKLQTTEHVKDAYHHLGDMPAHLAARFEGRILNEWKDCASCRRTTRSGLRHTFSGADLLPLPEDKQPSA